MAKRRDRPPLPQSCSLCREFSGLWMQAENGGLERCSCPRGQALAEGKRPLWDKRKKRSTATDGRMAATGEK